MMHYATCRNPCWEYDLISSCVPSGGSTAETVDICIFDPSLSSWYLTIGQESSNYLRSTQIMMQYVHGPSTPHCDLCVYRHRGSRKNLVCNPISQTANDWRLHGAGWRSMEGQLKNVKERLET